jgi:hypothetical protein
MRTNLVELDADVIRRMLETSTSLAGATAEAWTRASQQFADLWHCQLALDAVQAAVTAERGTRVSISRAATRRITELLDGTPVVLSELRPDGGRRSLTEGTHPELRCSIDDAISRMSVEYDGVVSVVGAVGVVWTELLGELEDLGAIIDRLEARGTTSGSLPVEDLGWARHQITELAGLARRDPLSVPPAALTPIRSAVERVNEMVAEKDAAIRSVEAALDAVQATVDACRRSFSRVRADYVRPDPKVAVPDAAWISLQEIDIELGATESELEAARLMMTTHPVEARRRGTALIEAVGGLDRRIDDLGSVEASGVAERDELRGRLAALRAKAHAVGLGEDPELDRIHDEARTALYSAPCDLPRALELVTSFQQTLRRSQEPAG